MTVALDINHQRWFKRCSQIRAQSLFSLIVYKGDLLCKALKEEDWAFLEVAEYDALLLEHKNKSPLPESPCRLNTAFSNQGWYCFFLSHLKLCPLLLDHILNGRSIYITISSLPWAFADFLLCASSCDEYFSAANSQTSCAIIRKRETMLVLPNGICFGMRIQCTKLHI